MKGSLGRLPKTRKHKKEREKGNREWKIWKGKDGKTSTNLAGDIINSECLGGTSAWNEPKTTPWRGRRAFFFSSNGFFGEEEKKRTDEPIGGNPLGEEKVEEKEAFLGSSACTRLDRKGVINARFREKGILVL